MRRTKPYHKRFHGDALNGYRRLSLELRGAYTTLLDEMYDHGGPIRDDVRMACAWLDCDPRVWKRVRAALVDEHAKLQAYTDDKGVSWLVNDRVQEVLGLPLFETLTANLSPKSAIAKPDVTAKSSENSKENNAPETALTRVRKEPEPIDSDPNGSGAERRVSPSGLERDRPPPEPPDPNKEAWDRGVAVLRRQGRCGEKAARSFFGRLLSEFKLEGRDLLPSVLRCETLKTNDPQGYLRRAAQALAQRNGAVAEAPAEVRVASWTDSQWRSAVEIFAESGRWGGACGPPPDEAGCRAPGSVLREFGFTPKERAA